MKLSFPVSTFVLLAASATAVEHKKSKRALRHSTGMYAHASKGTRIVGGTPAEVNEFPSIAIPDGGFNSCGATLIHPDVLMTAAHCQGVFANGGGVYIGGTTISGDNAVDNIAVVSEHPHPQYNGFTVENDIMLVKLAQPSLAQPTALNFEPTLPIDNEAVTAIGFGAISEGGPSSEILQKVTVDVVDFQTCQEQYQLNGDTILDEIMLCAGVPEGGKDTCQGDSGGPLFDAFGYQVGITSFGSGCARPGFPGVYARVSAFESFIKESICELSAVPPAECENGPVTPSGTVSLKLDLYFDSYASELTYEIRNKDTQEVVHTGPTGEVVDNGKLEESINVAAGDYEVKLFDSYGDGVCCTYGSGAFLISQEITPGDVRPIAFHDGQFEFEATFEFSTRSAAVAARV